MKDILECRIELLLLDVGSMLLCQLPDDDPMTVDEFTAATDRSCLHAAESLTRYFYFFSIRLLFRVFFRELGNVSFKFSGHGFTVIMLCIIYFLFWFLSKMKHVLLG